MFSRLKSLIGAPGGKAAQAPFAERLEAIANRRTVLAAEVRRSALVAGDAPLVGQIAADIRTPSPPAPASAEAVAPRPENAMRPQPMERGFEDFAEVARTAAAAERGMRAPRLAQPEAVVVLDRPIALDESVIDAHLREEAQRRFGSFSIAAAPRGAVLVAIGAHAFEVRPVAERSLDRLTPFLRSGFGPDPEEILAAYQAGLHVTPWGAERHEEDEASRRCIILALLASRLALLYRAIGVAWPPAAHLHAPDVFHDGVRAMLQGEPRTDLFVKLFGVKGETRADGSLDIGAVTRGLSCLAPFEIELLPSPLGVEAVIGLVDAVVRTVLADPLSVGAGEGLRIPGHPPLSATPLPRGLHVAEPVLQIGLIGPRTLRMA
jgi:hypothetical protein